MEIDRYNMIQQDQKIIFLNSYLPRTGHNFSAQVIRILSNHEVLTHSKSETRLSRILEAYNDISQNQTHYESERKFLDRIFIQDIRKKIIHESDANYIMIKDTTLLGVNHLPVLFPEDIHIILIRDPKNVFASLIKGMNLQKNNLKNFLKKIGNKTGIYPWFYSRKLSKQVINEIPDLKKHFIIRYEELVLKEEKVLLALKYLFHSEKSLDHIKKEIDDIRVINSSFYEEVAGKRIWDSRPRTEKFDPVNRQGNSWLIRKGIELGSKTLRKKLNYI